MSEQLTTYAPAAVIDGSDQEVLLESGPRPRGGWLPKGRLIVTACLAMVGVGALCFGRTGGALSVAAARVNALEDGVAQLANTADPCSNYPFVDLEEVLHSNLGKQGPNTGDQEGIVYKATDYVPGQPNQKLLIVVNASAAYKAGHPKYNGIHGKYGLITLKAGNEAEFTFRILDPKTGALKRLAKQEFTFFDLDQLGEGKSGTNREYLEVANADQTWLTKNTEIEVTALADGKIKFMSSQPGNGKDNPKDPLALTVQQKNRAVTIEFRDFDELKVTLGCTPGRHARYFMFVMRPSLLCAKTVGQVSADEDKPVVVDATQAPTPAPAAQQDCWWLVPIIKYCLKKFW